MSEKTSNVYIKQDAERIEIKSFLFWTKTTIYYVAPKGKTNE